MYNRYVNLALDNDGDAANEVRVGKCEVHYIYVHNSDDATIFLNLYNAAHGEVTPAETAVTLPISVPAAWAGTIPINTTFSTGLTICASATGAAGGAAPSPAPYVFVAYM